MRAAREPGVWTRRRVAALVLGYLAGLGGMILVKGVFLSADRYFLILLVPAVALGVGRGYVRDFLPFIALVLLYEEARGLAHSLHPHPFYEPMLTLDRWIGLGQVPTIRLQDWLWHGHLEWYDHAFSLLDRLHFIVPPTLLLLIWLERREVFYRCAATLLAVSFAGAATFLAFPAAPPWLASKHGLSPTSRASATSRAATRPSRRRSRGSSRTCSPTPSPPCPRCTPPTPCSSLLFAYAWRGRIGALGGALHARHVVHGRLPRRPLRRRHHRRRGLRERRLDASPAAPPPRPVPRACSGRSRHRSRPATRSAAMFYARGNERRRP